MVQSFYEMRVGTALTTRWLPPLGEVDLYVACYPFRFSTFGLTRDPTAWDVRLHSCILPDLSTKCGRRDKIIRR